MSAERQYARKKKSEGQSDDEDWRDSHLGRSEDQRSNEDWRTGSHSGRWKGVVWRVTTDDEDDIETVSCLDDKDTRSVYSTVRMTINSDVDQDNEVKDLKPVTIIEKKDSHSDSGDWVIDSGVSCHMMWNQDFFIVYKQKKSWVIIINRAHIESLSHDDVVIKVKNSSKMTI